MNEQTDATQEKKVGVPVKSRIPLYQVKLERNGTIVKEQVQKADAPHLAAAIFKKFLGDAPKEHFMLMCLDSRTRAIGVIEVSVGTVSASLVHPRECFQPAILLNAASIIVAHNHPSGDTSPSAEDKAVTTRLTDAGQILGIPLMDHIIIGDQGPDVSCPDYFSFRERGFIKSGY